MLQKSAITPWKGGEQGAMALPEGKDSFLVHDECLWEWIVFIPLEQLDESLIDGPAHQQFPQPGVVFTLHQFILYMGW